MSSSVKKAVDEVQNELRTKKVNLWTEIKKDHFQKQLQSDESISLYPRLPSASESNCVGQQSGSNFLSVTFHKSNDHGSVQIKPSSIEASHPPLPKSRTAILQNYSYMVDDEPEMKFTHNFDDDDEETQEEVMKELIELGAKARRYKFGLPHNENEFLIDATLNRLEGERALPRHIFESENYYARIAKLMQVDESNIRERHRLLLKQRSKIANKCKKVSESSDTATYDSAIDSYRELFCRRCFTYDCNIHGNLPKPNLDLLGELATQKEKDGKWKEIDGDRTITSTKDDCKNDDLSQIQQAICERLYIIFEGDTEKMAIALGTSKIAVESFVTLNKIKFHEAKFVTPKLLKRKRDKVQSYVSMRNYKPEYLKKIQSTLMHPAFAPCDHSGLCNQSNCSCIQNAFFCTKHCVWGCYSPNFFRGCSCKSGQCRTSACPCYAAKRECDPDLCRSCGACTDRPHAPASDGQRCRNDNISMKRGVRLLVGTSGVKEAGLGLFTQNALKKGDFVDDYVGEIVSQEEAERRGVVYDRQNMSFLFNLCSEFSIDATVKGNKTRYANHSDDPNIEPRLLRVNGDSRIGFFAIKDVAAEEELFFNYGYSTEIDNEHLFKPNHAHKFSWMENKSSNKREKGCRNRNS